MLMERLSIDKFAEGFVTACAEFGVAPEALVKTAQIINTRIPGYGQGAESALAKNPLSFAKVNPLTAATAPIADIGELGAKPQFTGTSAAPGAKPKALARMNISRKARGVAPINVQQAAPMPRRTGSQQFFRDVNALVPGANVGRNIDIARQGLRDEKNLADIVSVKGLAQRGKHYGGALAKTLLPIDAFKHMKETGEQAYEDVRGVFDPEWLEERQYQAGRAEEATGRAKKRKVTDRDYRRSQEGFAGGQEELQMKYKQDLQDWNQRAMAAQQSGADMDIWLEKNQKPREPELQWASEGRKKKVRGRPLLWSSPWQRRQGKGGRI